MPCGHHHRQRNRQQDGQEQQPEDKFLSNHLEYLGIHMGQAILGKLRYICQSAEAFSDLSGEFDFYVGPGTIGQRTACPARLREESAEIAIIFHAKSGKIFD